MPLIPPSYNSNTTFWISVWSGKLWSQFHSYIKKTDPKKVYTTLTDDYLKVKKGDVFLFYVKDKNRVLNGFKAVGKAKKKTKI